MTLTHKKSPVHPGFYILKSTGELFKIKFNLGLQCYHNYQ
ncbi:hypothetical protein LEP1GSC044_0559 [Leptospira kirschneri serovar Grippotyphosa str. RM52]|nr:hypothetical protein LEP1GSC044_0559 [Leptospira kirschneri serovar Grippotyphosa str. RM52]